MGLSLKSLGWIKIMTWYFRISGHSGKMRWGCLSVKCWWVFQEVPTMNNKVIFLDKMMLMKKRDQLGHTDSKPSWEMVSVLRVNATLSFPRLFHVCCTSSNIKPCGVFSCLFNFCKHRSTSNRRSPASAPAFILLRWKTAIKLTPIEPLLYTHETSYRHYLILTRVTNIVPVLQMRKLWLREVRELAQGHTARSGRAKIWP